MIYATVSGWECMIWLQPECSARMRWSFSLSLSHRSVLRTLLLWFHLSPNLPTLLVPSPLLHHTGLSWQDTHNWVWRMSVRPAGLPLVHSQLEQGLYVWPILPFISSTYQLRRGAVGASGTASTSGHNQPLLPLWGQLCCKLMAEPDCVSQPRITGFINVQVSQFSHSCTLSVHVKYTLSCIYPLLPTPPHSVW